MRTITFDEYWASQWVPTGQPAIFDAAMREVALKSWNACAKSAAEILEVSDDGIRLCAGELTPGEMRTTKAVLAGRAAAVKFLIEPEPGSDLSRHTQGERNGG